jgi:hypothetical protein
MRAVRWSPRPPRSWPSRLVAFRYLLHRPKQSTCCPLRSTCRLGKVSWRGPHPITMPSTQSIRASEMEVMVSVKSIYIRKEPGSPGNRGTVDIGGSNNSTNDIARQILHGISAQDLQALGKPLNISSQGTMTLNGDTGISAGVKDELKSIIGQKRMSSPFSRRCPETATTPTTRLSAG